MKDLMHVYLNRTPHKGLHGEIVYKIGVSGHIKQRLQAHKYNNDLESTICYEQCNNTKEAEKLIKAEFNKKYKRYRGQEFFECPEVDEPLLRKIVHNVVAQVNSSNSETDLIKKTQIDQYFPRASSVTPPHNVTINQPIYLTLNSDKPIDVSSLFKLSNIRTHNDIVENPDLPVSPENLYETIDEQLSEMFEHSDDRNKWVTVDDFYKQVKKKQIMYQGYLITKHQVGKRMNYLVGKNVVIRHNRNTSRHWPVILRDHQEPK